MRCWLDAAVSLPPEVPWELQVEQAVRAVSTLLRLAGIACQAMRYSLFRGWGLLAAGVVFTWASTVVLLRLFRQWLNAFGQVATG